MDEQTKYPFEFSVVMAVYNVEPFLREAVDSLVAQDFGFERIQLIMVDDGSTDGSGAICDEYAAQYPDNVLVIHKENGGVSSARNEGLKHVLGRFVNFLDSDDKLGETTLSAVHQFFAEHEEDTDIVAIPMFFFDGATGAHVQNQKFQKGTRIIDLIQQWQVVHLSCAASFFRHKVAKCMVFDESLAYCEDGKEIQRILLDQMTLGVVKEAEYFYRRRTQGELSAIQASYQNIKWYTPYLEGMTQSTISLCLERFGYIPKFTQYMLMYDLQWRILLENIPVGVLTPEEEAEFKARLFSILEYFDDDVIMAQRNIPVEHKAYLLRKKYGKEVDAFWRHNNATLHYKNVFLSSLDTNKTYLNFITLTEQELHIEGYTVFISGPYQSIEVFLEANGQVFPCAYVARDEDRLALGELICCSYGFSVQVPLDPQVETYELTLFCLVDGNRVDRKKLVFGKYCPISSDYQSSYYCHSGLALTTDGSKLYVQKCGRRGRIRHEWNYLKELWGKKRTGARKAVLARLLSAVLRPFIRKKIWLISDRVNLAGDNGEAFFRYMVKLKPRGIKPFFAISPSSPDYKRIKKIGPVIPFLGWRYKFLYLLADCVISSQAEEYVFHPFQEYSLLYGDLIQSQRFVFLQHGVLHNDLSTWLSRYNKNIAMFVTTTRQEYENILAGKYHYTANELKLTGLPRHDRLFHDEKKVIAIMPTWRAYLVTAINSKTGERAIAPGFTNSQYYAMYNKLLNDQRLFDAAEKNGYTITFAPHPNMADAEDMIAGDCRLKMISAGVSYRQIFAQSDLLVTDYSSVAFDFAYLRKPVVYFQQDKEEFYSGAHTLERGYFDHERDGFGEVEYSVDALVDRIVEYMESDCKLKEKYRKRIDATFPFSDQENCRRVYEAILEMESKP